MEASTPDTSYQNRWTTISIQQLANYSLQSDFLHDAAKATIANYLPSILSAGERIRASAWVVLSVIADCLTLRSRGIVTGEESSTANKLFLRFETVSVAKTSAKLKRRMELEMIICEPSFEHIGRLREVAWGEIGRFEELDARTRLDTGIFRDIRYVNKVLKGTFKRLEKRYRTAYDKYFSIGSNSYDPITLTKDIEKFAEQLRDGKVSGRNPSYYYSKRGWNELTRVVDKHLGKRAPPLTEDGKREIMDSIMNIVSWQGVNELSRWAVMHVSMNQVMAYGKVNCIYRAIYGYKGDPRRIWELRGWVIRYVAVDRKDDWTFKVPGEQYSVKLRQPNIEGGVWYAERTICEPGGIAVQGEDYEIAVQIDLNVNHNHTVRGQSACSQQ